MNSVRSRKKELYYTKDHEWIDFQGLVAFVGVCSFKLLGFNQIQQIVFANYPDFKKQGEVIATINYKDCKIQVNMPVDGKIIDLNKKLLTGKPNILLQAAENNTWIAFIVPSQPYERKNLLQPKQYGLITKRKF